MENRYKINKRYENIEMVTNIQHALQRIKQAIRIFR